MKDELYQNMIDKLHDSVIELVSVKVYWQVRRQCTVPVGEVVNWHVYWQVYWQIEGEMG